MSHLDEKRRRHLQSAARLEAEAERLEKRLAEQNKNSDNENFLIKKS